MQLEELVAEDLDESARTVAWPSLSDKAPAHVRRLQAANKRPRSAQTPTN